MAERELILRRSSNGSVKAIVRMRQATTITVYLLAKKRPYKCK